MLTKGIPGIGYINDCVKYLITRVYNHVTSFYTSMQQDLNRRAVRNVSGYRCEADCRSRGREFDPGPVPYFR